MLLDGSGSVSLAWFSSPASSSPPHLDCASGEGKGKDWWEESPSGSGLSPPCPGSSVAALLLGYTVGSCLSWETEAGHQGLLCPDRRRCESTPMQKAPFCLPSRNKSLLQLPGSHFGGKWSLFWALELISCLWQWPM